MQRVLGVGGVFFASTSDREALLAWYREHLGLEVEDWGGVVLKDASATSSGLTWSVFPRDTTYLGGNRFMINYKVGDLDAMLAQLRAAGVEVDPAIEESEYGRFGWAVDPEGHRFELWEPPAG